jgi:hypothetical protein
MVYPEPVESLQAHSQQSPSGQRLKLTAFSVRLSESDSVSGIAVKRKSECKQQQPRISYTIRWCNRLSNRPYHASSAPMTAFTQRDLLRAGAG